MLDRSAAAQDRFRNCRHLVVIGVRGVDHGQLHPPRIFRIIFRVAVGQPHVALDREQIGKQSTGQHDDDAGVGEMDAELLPRPTKTPNVRRDEIHEQDCADQMAAGKNWDLEAVSFRRPPDQHALEIALLRFPDSEMHLRDRAGKNQDHRRTETNNRKLQRSNQVDEFFQHDLKAN